MLRSAEGVRQMLSVNPDVGEAFVDTPLGDPEVHFLLVWA